MKLPVPSLAALVASVALAPSVRAEEAATETTATPTAASPAPEAQPEQPAAAVVTVAAPVDPAKNLLHAELATGAIGGVGLAAFSLGYERMLLDALSFRVGFGVTGGQRDSFGLGGGERHQLRGFGGFAMLHGLFGDTHKLEVGLGAGYGIATRKTRDASYVVTEDEGSWLAPQASLAYRYQPAEGGLFVRVGAMWSLKWGVPFGLGAGYAF
jgi:hypothetical protein